MQWGSRAAIESSSIIKRAKQVSEASRSKFPAKRFHHAPPHPALARCAGGGRSHRSAASRAETVVGTATTHVGLPGNSRGPHSHMPHLSSAMANGSFSFSSFFSTYLAPPARVPAMGPASCAGAVYAGAVVWAGTVVVNAVGAAGAAAGAGAALKSKPESAEEFGLAFAAVEARPRMSKGAESEGALPPPIPRRSPPPTRSESLGADGADGASSKPRRSAAAAGAAAFAAGLDGSASKSRRSAAGAAAFLTSGAPSIAQGPATTP